MSNDLFSGLDKASQVIREAVERGMAKAGMAVLRDCVMDMPKVPHDEGTLRGSGSVHVEGRYVFGSAELGQQGGTPNTDPFMESKIHEGVVAAVGFNTPYAARLHEHPEYQFTETGTGGKYLETKLASGGQRYINVVAAEVRKALG